MSPTTPARVARCPAWPDAAGGLRSRPASGVHRRLAPPRRNLPVQADAKLATEEWLRSERFIVAGTCPLHDGELERARRWGTALAEAFAVSEPR